MTAITPVTFSTFFQFYIFHADKAPTKREQIIAAVASAVLGILSLGLIHIFCFGTLYNRNIYKLEEKKEEDIKATRVFEESPKKKHVSFPDETTGGTEAVTRSGKALSVDEGVKEEKKQAEEAPKDKKEIVEKPPLKRGSSIRRLKKWASQFHLVPAKKETTEDKREHTKRTFSIRGLLHPNKKE